MDMKHENGPHCILCINHLDGTLMMIVPLRRGFSINYGSHQKEARILRPRHAKNNPLLVLQTGSGLNRRSEDISGVARVFTLSTTSFLIG